MQETIETSTRGLMYDRGGATWWDSREMDWETWRVAPEYPRLRKLLAADDEGHWLVMVLFLPPNFTDIIPDFYRNIHKNITEINYVLEGGLPTVEYASADADGQMVHTRPGWMLDRDPGSIHGHIAGHPTVTGSTMLFFANSLGLGPLEGNWVGESSYESESEDVPYEVAPDPTTGRGLEPVPLEHRAIGPDGIVLDNGACRRIDTDLRAWEPFADYPGLSRKVLRRDLSGEPQVYITHIPPTPIDGEPTFAYRHSHETVTEYSYVLEGELAVTEWANADQPGVSLTAKRGCFAQHCPGAIHGIARGQGTPTGAVLLQWRTGSGTHPLDSDYAKETKELEP